MKLTFGLHDGQVLLRWLLQNGHSAAPKARSPEHIKGNIDVFDFELSADAMSKLTQLKHQVCELTILSIS